MFTKFLIFSCLAKMSRKEALSQFINQIHGRPVVVKLNSGVDYRGNFFFLFICAILCVLAYPIRRFFGLQFVQPGKTGKIPNTCGYERHTTTNLKAYGTLFVQT